MAKDERTDGADPSPEELRGEEGARREEEAGQILADCAQRLLAGGEVETGKVLAEHRDLAPELRSGIEMLREISSAVDAERLLGTLGDFRVQREVGRGGMGIVFEAWQESLERRVALKVLPAGLLANPKAVARFQREAKVAARLHHPNIVSVYGLGTESGTPYFAMEFVDGRTLQELLRSLRLGERAEPVGGDPAPLRELSHAFGAAAGGSGPSPAPAGGSREAESSSLESATRSYCLRVAEAFAGAAEGLHHAHSQGVIHRDLKPSNLILERDGRLRILDFGLARAEGLEHLTLSGELLGTPLYMSPEQAQPCRAPVDHRTDIYSLGAALYSLLAWRPPFQGRDSQDTLNQIVTRDPRPLRQLNPRIPRDIETIVLKCLQKSPRDRYSTAEALGQDLRRCARGEPIEARPQPLIEKLARRAWRQKVRITLAAATVLLAVAGGLLLRDHGLEVERLRLADYERKVLGGIFNLHLGWPAYRTVEKRGLGFEDPAQATTRRFLERAVFELDEARKVLPGRAEAYYHRARALWLLDRSGEAVEEAARALRVNPRFVPAYGLRAAILESPRGVTGAGSVSPPEHLLGSGSLHSAWLGAGRALVTGRWQEATLAYSRLAGRLRDRPEPYAGAEAEIVLGWGTACLKQHGGASGAVGLFQRARYRWPERSEPVFLVGKGYALKQETAPARGGFFDFFARWGSHGEAAALAAAVYHEYHQYAEALEWAGLAGPVALREQLVADLLAHLGRFEEALPPARRAVELAPSDPFSHTILAAVLAGIGRREESARAGRRALELAPRDDALRYQIGLALEQDRRGHEADPIYREALRLNPAHAGAALRLGGLLLGGGRSREAVEALEGALRAGADDPALRRLLARTLASDPAARAPEGAREVFEPGRWRRAGRIATFKEVDAALEAREPLVPEGALWRFFRGRSEPSSGALEWAGPDFDDSAWETAPSGFGYGGEEAVTVLEDMRGSYGSLYLRHAFTVEDPSAVRGLVLSVAADDGYVAYLNGVEVARARAPGAKHAAVPPGAGASGAAPEPLAPAEAMVDIEHLLRGRNLLAVQGLNQAADSSDFSLIPVLEVQGRPGGPRDRDLLEEFRRSARGQDASKLLLYLEGRVRERAGDPRAAAVKLAQTHAAAGDLPEPLLHLALSLRAAGEPRSAEAALREGLEKELSLSTELWELWLEVALVDLGWGPVEALERLPATPRRGSWELPGLRDDIAWALGSLRESGAIRIDCGGGPFRGRSGADWGEDCFAVGGYHIGEPWDVDGRRPIPIEGTEDDPLYQTHRWIEAGDPAPAYRVPLPKGRYRVVLHFADIETRPGGPRSFDVRLEGSVVLEDYDIVKAAGFATAAREAFEVRVEDGFLDLDLVARHSYPLIAGLEIVRLP